MIRIVAKLARFEERHEDILRRGMMICGAIYALLGLLKLFER